MKKILLLVLLLAAGGGAYYYVMILQPPAQQKQTVSDVRNTGTAMFSWLTDQVGSIQGARIINAQLTAQAVVPGCTSQTIDLASYPKVSHADMVRLLVPKYMQTVPEKDGWGNPYEYYLNERDPLSRTVMLIRSAGRDGKVSASAYCVEGFAPSEYEEDIVWADGFFVRWPQSQISGKN